MHFVLSQAAEADLDDIWQYTVATWGVDQAISYTRQFQTAFTRLAAGVVSGRSAEDIRTGYLKITVGKHVAFYLIKAEQIEIIRILHQRMDVEAEL